jgi:hypothetical protein
MFQNMPLNRSNHVGFTMEADIVFDSSYGQVHDVLSNFFGFTEPSLHLTCGLGVAQDWHQLIWAPSFHLTGIFADAKPKPPCDKLQLTSVGARLTGYHTSRYDNDGRMVQGKAYGYALFGMMHVPVPGSVIPLEMDFIIEEAGGSVRLEATLKGQWEHAFGISQLTASLLASYSGSLRLTYTY